MRFFVFLMIFAMSLSSWSAPLTIGQRQYLRIDEAIPEIPGGTIWKIIRIVQNPTMSISIPGFKDAGGDRKFYEAELVDTNQIDSISKYNLLDVGGFIRGSDSSFEMKIIVSNGEHALAAYEKIVERSSVSYVVGQTTEVSRDPAKLTKLPSGYSWIESSRVSGVTTLIPTMGGNFRSAGDNVTYKLAKNSPELPDSFELPVVKNSLGRAYVQILGRINGPHGCTAPLEALVKSRPKKI